MPSGSGSVPVVPPGSGPVPVVPPAWSTGPVIERGPVTVAGLIEAQATAEKGSFSRAQLNSLVDLDEVGLKEIFAAQRALLER